MNITKLGELPSLAQYVAIPPIVRFDMFTGSFGVLAAVFIICTSPFGVLSTQRVYLIGLVILHAINAVFFLTGFVMLASTYSMANVNGVPITCGDYIIFGQLQLGSVGQQAEQSADILCRHRDSGIAFGAASWVLWSISLGISCWQLYKWHQNRATQHPNNHIETARDEDEKSSVNRSIQQ